MAAKQISLIKPSAKKLNLAVLVFAMVSGFMFLSVGRVSALSGADFNAGRIMDDSVFYNSNTMSASQIQNFLNAKVPVCDTNGEKMINSTQTRAQWAAANGKPLPPYICLKGYSQSIPTITNSGSDLCTGSISGGTKSAAQIINDVSKACGVNQQVLIVLLQKEQSLVTDDWPWPIQYRSATGYGCPDTAPCDAEFYGFFNQVYQAAKGYKRYQANPHNYNYRAGRDNTILWHPNHGCGTSNVFIQNQATAGLYIYTPYRPNQAALNNLYGMGDGCSSYGNRNFWRMFNDWFGSTLGSLIRTTSSATLYFTDENKKFLVPSMSLANQFGLGLNDVRYVSEAEINAIPLASTPFSNSIGQLVKSDSDSDEDGATLYLVSNGNRFPISSMTQFSQFGFNENDIKIMPLATIHRLIPAPNNLSNFIKGSSATIYKAENAKKRTIFELSKLDSANPSGNISRLSNFTIGQIPVGVPLSDGDFATISPNGSVRLYNGDNSVSYFRIASMDVYSCLGIPNIKKFKVSNTLIGGSLLSTMSCFVKNSSGNEFIMANSVRYALPAGLSVTTNNPPDTLINRLSEHTLKPVIKPGSGATLAIIENGMKRPIPNMAIFDSLGYKASDISVIPSSAFNTIATGPLLLSPSIVMSGQQNSLSVINGPDNSLIIASIGRYQAFNFGATSVWRFDQQTKDAYAGFDQLSFIVKTDESNLFIVDSGRRHRVELSLDVHTGINRSTTQIVDHRVLQYTSQKLMTRFIKSNNNSTVFYLDNGTKRPVSSWSKLVELGGENNITVFTQATIDHFPTGANI